MITIILSKSSHVEDRKTRWTNELHEKAVECKLEDGKIQVISAYDEVEIRIISGTLYLKL